MKIHNRYDSLLQVQNLNNYQSKFPSPGSGSSNIFMTSVNYSYHKDRGAQIAKNILFGNLLIRFITILEKNSIISKMTLSLFYKF